MTADHANDVAKLTRLPWSTWPWSAFRYKVRLVGWAKDATVPGIDFDHFIGKGSEAVIKMVEPRDTTILQGQEEKSGVRVVAWTDGMFCFFDLPS